MVNLSEVKFYKSVGLGSQEEYIDEKKEIIFVGRSNIGKSSLMNSLFKKKDLVKTSARPGKTKLVNLFEVENKYFLTDLPGYGFAKLGKGLKEKLDGLISWYIEEKKENIKRVFILIDTKLGPQQTDIDMYKFLLELEMPVAIVLSKIDKISKNELSKSINFTKNKFFGQEVYPVSSLKKTGLKDLEKYIKSILVSK